MDRLRKVQCHFDGGGGGGGGGGITLFINPRTQKAGYIGEMPWPGPCVILCKALALIEKMTLVFNHRLDQKTVII